MASKIRHLFSRNPGHATRPIQRDVRSQDELAEAFTLAHHNAATASRHAPQVSPGLLVTQPDLAGRRAAPAVGGGYFAPPSKTSKFR